MPATIAIALFRGDHTPTRSRLHKLSATRRAAEPGAKVRERSPTFSDHFSQATQFWNSMSDWEKDHIAAAFAFELNQVVDDGVRNRTMNEILVNIGEELAKMVSEAPGVAVAPAGAPEASTPSVPPPSGPLRKEAAKLSSPALSMDKAPPPLSLVGTKVAVLVGNGADARDVQAALAALGEEGFFAGNDRAYRNRVNVGQAPEGRSRGAQCPAGRVRRCTCRRAAGPCWRLCHWRSASCMRLFGTARPLL